MHANVASDRGGGGGSWRLPADETLQVSDPKEKLDDDFDYGESHNWKSIVFALLVIGFVIAGIVTAIYLLGYVDELLYWSGRRILLDEYLQGELVPNRLPPTWVSRNKFVYQTDEGHLALYETTNNTVRTLVTNHTLRQLNVKGYQCSTNLDYVLFKHNVKYVFRKSFTAFYTVYDVTKDHHMPVRLKTSVKVQRTRLQFASWLGNTTSLAIVVDNDIYIRQSPANEEDVRITVTGKPELIYNGIPDWLYQEEIFTAPEAIWSSNDGTHIMFASFDDTNVGTMTYPWFSTGAITTSHLSGSVSFPETRTLRYPTPGTNNPVVYIEVVDISNIFSIQRWNITPPIALDGQEYYITSASWVVENHQISVVYMNRAQNSSIVAICFAPKWTCIETHTERAPEDEWLDILPHPVFSPDGDSFLLLASIQETGTEHFTHIKHVTITQQRISVISHGRYEVIKILAWDTENHMVYYLGTSDSAPGQQHFYSVKDPLNHDTRKLEPKCLTCDAQNTLWSSKRLYENCTFFDAFVSPSSSLATEYRIEQYVLECQGPSLPVSGVHSVQTNHLLVELFNIRNTSYQKLLDDLALPKRQSFEIALEHGTRAQVQLLLPPSWREELRDAAFPVLVEVNGRPGTISITDKYQMDWGTYMSSRNDVIYIRLDVRGSKGQSKKALFRHLGGVEVQDQIDAVRFLLRSRLFLDETRVGIWGWGFGGYVTAMVLGTQQNVFKCGIAVSPISDWSFFNSVFTERVLGLPNENYKGYVEADATQRARHIPSNSLFLLHGLADLTAPHLHGVQLAQKLAEAGKLFQYQTYADEDHHLTNVVEHVYKSMEHYLKNCLSLDADSTDEANKKGHI